MRARKLGVGQRAELVLHGVDRLDPWPRRLDAAIVGGAEDLAGEAAETDHPMVLSIRSFAGGRRRNPPYRHAEADSTTQKAPGKRFWTQRRRTDKRGLNRCQRCGNARRQRRNPPHSGVLRRRLRLPDRRCFDAQFRPAAPLFATVALPLQPVAVLPATPLRRRPRRRTRRPPARRPPRRAAPDPATVVATIDGKPVTEADLALGAGELDQQFAQLPPEQRRAAAFSAIIEIRLLAAKAVAEGLDKDAGLPAPHGIPAAARAAQRAGRQGGRRQDHRRRRSAPATTRRWPTRRRSTRSRRGTSW